MAVSKRFTNYMVLHLLQKIINIIDVILSALLSTSCRTMVDPVVPKIKQLKLLTSDSSSLEK
ncbi:hypothetical protein [Xenorhabdus sp. KJ12.1]|uniref:hypothetical protein n=1 Tax=Xenorhabdus sp. KJ12.1 TaxID=1851571 RepID=UPI0012906603|nr:hypothetical protein [Xenorhabdus sp. KJ12.1]